MNEKDVRMEDTCQEKSSSKMLGLTRRLFIGVAGVATATLALGNPNTVLTAFAEEGAEGFEEPSTGSEENLEQSEEVEALGDTSAPILLASFFNSDADNTDTLYASTNGTFFEKISVAYQDGTPNDPSSNKLNLPNWPYNVHPLHDPSILYKNGWYFMLSGFTNHDTPKDRSKFIPMIGYSKDLVNWSYPQSGSDTNVSLTELPNLSGRPLDPARFDIVAPDWMLDDDGSAWIVFSAGYYGQFHGRAQDDTMFPYLVKASNLAPSPYYDPRKSPDAWAKVSYGRAKPIKLPQYHHNRIDGSLYKEGGTYYLSIKRAGVTNEIWKTNDLNRCDQPGAWTLVNSNVVTGFEGPCLTKYKGKYYYYTDKLADFPPDNHDGTTGTHVTWSNSLGGGWGYNQRIMTVDAWGRMMPNRHGTVIQLSGGAAKAVWERRVAAGWPMYNAYTDFDDVKYDMAVARGQKGSVWYVKDGWLENVVKKGIMSGYASNHNFGPYDNITRGQVATILYRFENKKTAANTNNNVSTRFSDVAKNQYYSAAVRWASEKGIVTGYTGTSLFRPDQDVTREELATMIARYAGFKLNGKAQPPSADPKKMNALHGANQVSAYAKAGMAWCCANDVIGGVSGKYLEPRGGAWRASMAKMITVTEKLI